MNQFSQNDIQTPYQGKKRCFGEFICQNCGKTWKSANSRANTPQDCSRCNAKVYPQKQSSLENVFADLRAHKMVKFNYLNHLAKTN